MSTGRRGARERSSADSVSGRLRPRLYAHGAGAVLLPKKCLSEEEQTHHSRVAVQLRDSALLKPKPTGAARRRRATVATHRRAEGARRGVPASFATGHGAHQTDGQRGAAFAASAMTASTSRLRRAARARRLRAPTSVWCAPWPVAKDAGTPRPSSFCAPMRGDRGAPTPRSTCGLRLEQRTIPNAARATREWCVALLR